MVPTQGITWLFSCLDIIPIISIQGRKGDENYAIYTTISCARGQADSSLYEWVFQKEEGVEDTVLNKLEAEHLHSAIQQLSEIQRRRLMNYYFEDKNYEQIAQEEGCSFQMVAKSVKAAIRNLKKILR